MLTDLARADGVSDRSRPDPAALFTEGEQAFARGEARRAAELFEEAYALAPHRDVAWNAAQAWQRAGDEARAATFFDIFLAAPAGADRTGVEVARAALDKAAPSLGRLEIEAAPGVTNVRVDERRAPAASVFVAPGDHRVTGEGASAARAVSVAAGQTSRVVLAVPPVAPVATPRPPGVRIEAPPDARAGGLPPWVVVAGGAVTVGLGATTFGFGAATDSARDEFDRTRSPDVLEEGRAKQDLTNGFFWGTVAAFALTTTVAVFLVDWKRPIFSF